MRYKYPVQELNPGPIACQLATLQLSWQAAQKYIHRQKSHVTIT